SINERIQQNVQPDAAAAMQEEMVRLLGALFRGGMKNEEEALKISIQIMETQIGPVLCGLSKEELAACLPAELKNQADADVLRGLGANNLADLCVLDLEIKPEAPAKNKPPKTFHKYKF
ncbi:MAG: hypothetical protein HY052_03790, partial [Proteobacteria bacterium]|nr:hypothetical protein [Pseudomonadota bacterium]